MPRGGRRVIRLGRAHVEGDSALDIDTLAQAIDRATARPGACVR